MRFIEWKLNLSSNLYLGELYIYASYILGLGCGKKYFLYPVVDYALVSRYWAHLRERLGFQDVI